MLCSICNKNTAVIFINKQMPDNSVATEGFCYDCAKKKGINPLDALTKNANISEEDIKNMTEQLENMFQDMSPDMDIDPLVEGEDIGEDGSMPNGMPLGAIFSNLFGKNEANSNGSSNGSEKKK